MKLEIKFAIIYCIISLSWLLLEFLAGLHTKYIEYHPIVTMFALVPSVLVYRKALISKKELLGGTISLKDALKSGLLLTVFIAILSPILLFVFYFVINPSFFDTMIKYSVENRKATFEQATDYFNFNSYLQMTVAGGLFIGTLISVISALIVRDKK
jgi:hypothetical protein